MVSDWELRYTRKFDKKLSKIRNRKLKKKILNNTEKLIKRPKKGKLLSGKPRQYGIRSLKISNPNGEMRVLYRLIESKKIIQPIYFDTRENIYEFLKRSL
jgi:mRNA-degrading endonuclease RelE of RelBE toxin-antitoxin system